MHYTGSLNALFPYKLNMNSRYKLPPFLVPFIGLPF